MNEGLRTEKYVARILKIGIDLEKIKKGLKYMFRETSEKSILLHAVCVSGIPNEIEKIRKLILSEIDKIDK